MQELERLAESQPRGGCQKMTDYLRNEGHRWHPQRIRRGSVHLARPLRSKPKKRLAARTARALGGPVQSDLTWSLEFMSDSLSNARAMRTLNTAKRAGLPSPGLVDRSRSLLPAERVVRGLDNLWLWRAPPKQIRLHNGRALISPRLERWAKEKQIELLHLQPGQPAQTADSERFHRTFREEVLDAYLFEEWEEVRMIPEGRLEEYNTIRPHEALPGVPPRPDAIQNA